MGIKSDINLTWNNKAEKLRKLNHELETEHKRLNGCKKFETYMQIWENISRIQRHIEVVKNLLNDFSPERERCKEIKYAVHPTK